MTISKRIGERRRRNIQSRRSLQARRRAQITLESLEARSVMSTVTWDGGGGNLLWPNPLNRSGDVTIIIHDLPTTKIASLNL